MDTILSFVLVVLFSAWIFRLKTEIYTLEKLVGVGNYAPAPLKPALAVSSPVSPRPGYDRSVNPVSAPSAMPLPPNNGKTARKGGVPVWTLED